MKKKAFIFTSLLITIMLSATYFTSLKYKKLQRIEALGNTRQDAVLEATYDYEEPDNPLFYTGAELTEYLANELETETDEEDINESLELIKQICPYVEVDENGIRVPKTEDTKEIQLPPTVQVNANYNNLINNLIAEAETCLGTPYIWGGSTIHKGMDCSGFTQYIYKQIGFTLPRVSKDQSKVGKLVLRSQLKPGDLLFFDTTNYRDSSDIKTPESEAEYAVQIANGYVPNVVSHVGLYVGNGMMIHAASGDGYVKYESLDNVYYKTRFINARRYIRDN